MAHRPPVAGGLFFLAERASDIGAWRSRLHPSPSGRHAERRLLAPGHDATWQAPFSATSGLRAYYLYDGSDVGVIVERQLGGQSFGVRTRYVTGGLDAQWVSRVVTPSGTRVNLALVPDEQGTTVAAVYEGDTLSVAANYCDRDAYGAITPGLCGTASGVNTETGYGGASTPNTNGGFVYLRNRWYDPQNGRFLTQDPIGLAGGVNLYAYAGNNPTSFSDPFGLWPWPTLHQLVNFSAGFGDAASLGVTSLVRRAIGADAVVDHHSGAYVGGAITGMVADALITAGSSTEAEAAGGEAEAEEGVVYRRTNPKTGEQYVGRSKDPVSYLRRQAAHDRNLGVAHDYEVIGRAENGTQLRVAEESAIREGGGPGALANKRFEMNDEAYKAAGGTVPKP